ncbi:hypothetical protein KEM48_009891 [Puccinia striiformis f. sp. tritici PST-130]|nr:hypothetical protein KEM48_009891 [Puccinia striiformis f. sp. tritici PST-130]
MQENQHKLAGLYSEIELLVKDTNPARNPQQAREQADFMDMQNNNFTAALESMKDWVLDTQKKQIQLIFEMAMRNSGKLVKQRNELKLQIELGFQKQNQLDDKLATLEHNFPDFSHQKSELQLVHATRGQTMASALLLPLDITPTL